MVIIIFGVAAAAILIVLVVIAVLLFRANRSPAQVAVSLKIAETEAEFAALADAATKLALKVKQAASAEQLAKDVVRAKQAGEAVRSALARSAAAPVVPFAQGLGHPASTEPQPR